MAYEFLFISLVNGEVALVFAGGSGEDEAEEPFSDAGEVIVVFHAVGRQGGGVNGDTEAVLYIEGVHARVRLLVWTVFLCSLMLRTTSSAIAAYPNAVRS